MASFCNSGSEPLLAYLVAFASFREMVYRNGHDQASGADIASTQYAQRMRELINLITKLRGVGAQADIDLPRIAVIGNQSAGKSSLVEAISGITVPRASGTCTRCPMECRLQKTTGAWRCQVWLRMERNEQGKRIPKVHEIPFGPPVTDKSKLEEVLRRAQLAILNPSVPHASFVDFDTSKVVTGEPLFGDKKSLQFSTNVVALDICGPELADLDFIDLPGIISNVGEGEDRNNITLVQKLVKEHIKGNALILLTLTMRDDLENQSAAFLAKEADPEGMRTIGVLTKADTVLAGEESGWMEVLEGRRHPLKNGYYVTKQPGPELLKQRPSFEEARLQEQKYFASTEPWNSCSNLVQSRIGIPNLTAELSKLLSQLIMHTLPKLRDDARKAHAATVKELEALPPPMPDNPIIELLGLLTTFSTVAKQWIEGTERYEGLVQIYRSAGVEFKTNICRTAPNFRPFENAMAEGKNIPMGAFGQIEDTIEDNEGQSSPMFLLDVRKHIKISLGRELPYNVPFSAKRNLIEASFETWRQHALTFFDTVCEATRKQLYEEIEAQFARFSMSPLKDNVKSVIENQVNHFRKETRDRINWYLDMEHPPFTQNLNYFSSSREIYISQYKAKRRGLKLESDSVCVNDVLRQLADIGFHEVTVDDLYKLSKSDDYEEELIVMAEVRAYWRIAYKRIIDDVPRIANQDFLHALGDSLYKVLIEAFGIGSDDATQRAKVYLAEDPGDVAKREELTAKEQRLDDVLKKLFNFGL